MSHLKKIAIVYLGHRGAGPIFTLRLAAALSERAITKVFLSHSISNYEEWKKENLDTAFFHVPHTTREALNPTQIFTLRKTMCSKIKEFHPDICLFTMIYPMNFLIQHSLKKSGYKIVSIIHDPFKVGIVFTDKFILYYKILIG
ncbi:MAG: hypothetical protein ABIM18_08715 [candidate division WOR-3 bacterium]